MLDPIIISKALAILLLVFLAAMHLTATFCKRKRISRLMGMGAAISFFGAFAIYTGAAYAALSTQGNLRKDRIRTCSEKGGLPVLSIVSGNMPVTDKSFRCLNKTGLDDIPIG